MQTHLTKKDYVWTAFVLLLAFVLLPLGLWRISVYRVQKIKAETMALVPLVMQEARSEVQTAVEYLLRGATSTLPGAYEEAYSLPNNGSIKRACDGIQAAVMKQDARYRMPDWNCSFVVKTEKGFFRGDVSAVPRQIANHERYEGERLETLVRSGKEWDLQDNTRSYWVYHIVRTEPLIGVTFMVQPADRDY